MVILNTQSGVRPAESKEEWMRSLPYREMVFRLSTITWVCHECCFDIAITTMFTGVSSPSAKPFCTMHVTQQAGLVRGSMVIEEYATAAEAEAGHERCRDMLMNNLTEHRECHRKLAHPASPG